MEDDRDEQFVRAMNDAMARFGGAEPLQVDPDLADRLGAFDELALEPQDALDAAFDGEEAGDGEA